MVFDLLRGENAESLHVLPPVRDPGLPNNVYDQANYISMFQNATSFDIIIMCTIKSFLGRAA